MRTVKRFSGSSSLVSPGGQCRDGFGTRGEVRRHYPWVIILFLQLFFVFSPLPAGLSSGAIAGVVVISNESLRGIDMLDRNTLSRIYTGRAVQVAGISVHPVNMKTGNATRAAFIKEILNQSDDDYIAYWIVRHAIGKGTPPVEVNSAEEMVDFVRSTPGAIGYIDTSKMRPGVRSLLVFP